VQSQTLSNLLESSFPDQVPFGLKILPLLTEITSWLTSLLCNQPQKEQWSKEPAGSKFMLGHTTNSTYNPSGCSMTNSSTISTMDKSIESSELLLSQSERLDLVITIKNC